MQISAEKIWNTAQEHLRVKLSRDTFNMWFAPLRPCFVDGQQLTIEAPNEFCEVWLKDNYLSLLQDAVAVAAGCRLQVKFKVANARPRRRPRGDGAARGSRQSQGRRTGRLSAPTATTTSISTPRTPSSRLSSAPTTIFPLPPPRPWPRRPANPTIRCFFTAAWAWARRICCTPSASM